MEPNTDLVKRLKKLNIYEQAQVAEYVAEGQTMEHALFLFEKRQRNEIKDYENSSTFPTVLLQNFHRTLLPPIRDQKSKPTHSELDINSFDVDYFAYTREQLIDYAVRILLTARIKLGEEAKVRAFVADMANRYNFVPFHNFTHAFSILHICYLMMKKLEGTFDQEEELGLLLGALGHDVGHPGLNNAFLKKVKHPFSLPVNDKAILENYHMCATWQVMENHQLLNGVVEDIEKVRKVMIDSILSTDMMVHFKILEEFKTSTETSLLLGVILHAADIGNATFNFEGFKEWGLRITQEMQDQYDAEKALGLHPAEFMKYGDEKSYAKGQCGFVRAFSLPLWEAIATKWPQFKP